MLPRSLPLIALLVAGVAHAGGYRVVGGSQAAEGAWPDAAAVCFGSCGQWGVGCTGVLVAPDVVLTAGHCVAGGDSPTAVMLNSNDYVQNRGEIIQVQWSRAHPTYNGYGGYDIAILKLAQPSQTAVPRSLVNGCVADEYLYDGADVAIVGYGAHDQNGRQYDSLLREAFTTITDADCTDISSGCVNGISPGGELGAGGSGVDACFGDSGGPLYLLTEVGDYVVGTTSRAYQYVSVPCRDGGIYVRPDAVRDWIESTASVELPDTTCNYPPAPSEGGVFSVPAGKTKTKKLNARDPDQNSGHIWEILDGPSHGEASIDGGGVLSYSPFNDGYLGPDSVTVRVTDTQGIPHHAVDMDVALEVVEGGCGCSTSSGPAAGWLGVLVGLLALRRRRD